MGGRQMTLAPVSAGRRVAGTAMCRDVWRNMPGLEERKNHPMTGNWRVAPLSGLFFLESDFISQISSHGRNLTIE